MTTDYIGGGAVGIVSSGSNAGPTTHRIPITPTPPRMALEDALQAADHPYEPRTTEPIGDCARPDCGKHWTRHPDQWTDHPSALPRLDAEAPEAPFAELLTVEASCGSTQHDFTAADASPNPSDFSRPVLFCRLCGQVRKLEVPR